MYEKAISVDHIGSDRKDSLHANGSNALDVNIIFNYFIKK